MALLYRNLVNRSFQSTRSARTAASALCSAQLCLGSGGSARPELPRRPRGLPQVPGIPAGRGRGDARRWPRRPGPWKRARGGRGGGRPAVLTSRRRQCGLLRGRGSNHVAPPGGGGEGYARRKRKALLPGDARSRGVLPTWALTIGGVRADVPAAARARTAERAAPRGRSARRARSRGSPRPRSPPANPLARSLFAPSWPRPLPGSAPPPPGRRRAERASRDGWPRLFLSVPY